MDGITQMSGTPAAVAILCAVLACPSTGCGERKLSIYPRMKLEEVEARSSGFSYELTHDNAELGMPNLPSPTVLRKYSLVSIHDGDREHVSTKEVKVSLRVLHGEVIDITLLGSCGPMDARYQAIRDMAAQLARSGWQGEAFPQAAPPLEALVDGPHPVHRKIGSFESKRDGVIAIFTLHWQPHDKCAWFDVFFDKMDPKPPPDTSWP